MKKIVIVGGGFAGSIAARKLENYFDVILIDSKDYFEFTPGILRTIVNPNHTNKIQVLHKNYLKKAKFVKGTVENIDSKNVFINGEKIKFDYLLICSGSKYSLPIKQQNTIIATRANVLKKNYEKLKKAKSVLIIGGGLVGVELAAEVCENYKDKKIKLVHANSRLIERNPEKASEYAKKFLEKGNVEVVLNEFFKGKAREDLVFVCTGIVPNSSFMKDNFKDNLDEKNQIIVNDFLQLKNQENIFVAGDVNNVNVEKTAQNAEKQAKIVAENITALEKNKDLKKNKAKTTPIVLSLGKWNGIFIRKNFVLTGFIPGLMKSFIEFWFMKDYAERQK
jgi:NADH dehydrogenase FAD-containing subunit